MQLKIKEEDFFVEHLLVVTNDMMDRVDALVKAQVDVITLDTAHGHSKGVIEGVKKIKANIQNFK